MLPAGGAPAGRAPCTCDGTLEDVLYHGASSRCHVRVDAATLLAVARAESAAGAAAAAGLAACGSPGDRDSRVRSRRAEPCCAPSSTFFAADATRSTSSLLLLPPLLWLGTVYLGSLFALLLQSFYAIDEFTARVVPELTLATYRQLFTHPANVDIVVRTLLMADRGDDRLRRRSPSRSRTTWRATPARR